MYCVYKIQFNKIGVLPRIYIGQTDNYKSRIISHKSAGIIKKMTDDDEETSYLCEIIEDNIAKENITEREKYYVRYYQNNSNFIILNKYLVKKPTRIIIYEKHNQIKVFIDDNTKPLFQTTYKQDKFYKALGKMVSKYNKWCDEQYLVCNVNIEYH